MKVIIKVGDALNYCKIMLTIEKAEDHPFLLFLSFVLVNINFELIDCEIITSADCNISKL
jgi:hypothetical protein